MHSEAIRALSDRYGRYNQEPDLFLQIVQALEEFRIHMAEHEREAAESSMAHPVKGPSRVNGQ